MSDTYFSLTISRGSGRLLACSLPQRQLLASVKDVAERQVLGCLWPGAFLPLLWSGFKKVLRFCEGLEMLQVKAQTRAS